MIIPAGSIIFAASDTTQESIDDARKYIKRNKYTRADCRLVKRDGQTLIISERDIGKK